MSINTESSPYKMPPLIPELQVSDIGKSLRFYREILGFSVEFERPETKFAMISLQGSWIMIEQTDNFGPVSDKEFVEAREWRTGALEHPFGRGINFQIAVDDIDTRYAAVNQMKYPIKMPIEERWYRADELLLGTKQFMVMDPDGYLLRIQQSLGSKPAR